MGTVPLVTFLVTVILIALSTVLIFLRYQVGGLQFTKLWTMPQPQSRNIPSKLTKFFIMLLFTNQFS